MVLWQLTRVSAARVLLRPVAALKMCREMGIVPALGTAKPARFAAGQPAPEKATLETVTPVGTVVCLAWRPSVGSAAARPATTGRTWSRCMLSKREETPRSGAAGCWERVVSETVQGLFWILVDWHPLYVVKSEKQQAFVRLLTIPRALREINMIDKSPLHGSQGSQ